jgi:hypothetical protein
VRSRVMSSDNNTVVPDSANSSMVVLEMTSLALPACPQQELCCWYKNMCVRKTYTSTPMTMAPNYVMLLSPLLFGIV